MTYNVWQTSNPFSKLKTFTCSALALKCDKDNRAENLIRIIKNNSPDLILLQEAGVSFRNKLKHSIPNAYLFYSEKSGLAIFSKFKLSNNVFVPFPSYMNRGMLFSKIHIANQDICITNIHLESLLDDTESRKTQLSIIFKKLYSCDISILAGDFNFSDSAEEQTKIPPTFHDSWLKKNQKPGFTYNIENNLLAQRNALYGEKSRRLDRIYYTGKHFSINSISLLGTKQPVPSDHYGLIAIFHLLD
jgi:endonuclease/exonuclease/phosphatase family metal-dependent hydrolase